MGGFLNSNKRLWVISIGIVILLVLLIKPTLASTPCEAQCHTFADEKGGIFVSSTCDIGWPGYACITMGGKTYSSVWDPLPLGMGALQCGCNLQDASPYCNYYIECDPSGPACNPSINPPCTPLRASTGPSANCSGTSANYNCAVECAKSTQPAACELCCK